VTEDTAHGMEIGILCESAGCDRNCFFHHTDDSSIYSHQTQ
jgi:hypothetical protein